MDKRVLEDQLASVLDFFHDFGCFLCQFYLLDKNILVVLERAFTIVGLVLFPARRHIDSVFVHFLFSAHVDQNVCEVVLEFGLLKILKLFQLLFVQSNMQDFTELDK